MKFQIISWVLVTCANCITLSSGFIDTRNLPRRRESASFVQCHPRVCYSFLLQNSTLFFFFYPRGTFFSRRLICSNRNNGVSYASNTFIPQTFTCLSGSMMKHTDHMHAVARSHGSSYGETTRLTLCFLPCFLLSFFLLWKKTPIPKMILFHS